MPDNPYAQFDGPVTAPLAAQGGNPYAEFGTAPPPAPVASSVPIAAAPSHAMPAAMRWPLGLGAATAYGGLTALGLPGEIERLGTQYVANPLSRMMGLSQDTSGQTFFPTTKDMLSLAPGLSTALGGPLAPQSGAERLAQGAASGLGSTMLPALATGGTSVPLAVASAAGGAAGEGAAMMGLPPALQVGAGMAAGLATHAAGALAGARTLPRIASELGSSRTLEEAGSVLQDEAQNWRNTVMPQSINEAAAPLDAMIPGEAVSAAGNFGTGLSDLISKGGSSANAVRYFLDTTEASKGALGQTANRMNDWLKASRIGLAGAPEAPTMTWAEMRDFRTELGQHMRTARENEKPALERIYGGLTQDMGGLAQQYGAGDQFARFNIVSTLAHQLDAGPIEKILSAQQPGDAAARLLAGARRGGETLETLRGVLPTGVNELAAAHLNMNPDARAWARLAPEGQSALVPQAADRSIIERTGPVKGDPGIGTKMLESLVGGAVTGAGARILGQALVPGMNPLVTEAAGELVGNAMPFAWRGMVGTVRHPALTLTGGLAGGIGGTLP